MVSQNFAVSISVPVLL